MDRVQVGYRAAEGFPGVPHVLKACRHILHTTLNAFIWKIFSESFNDHRMFVSQTSERMLVLGTVANAAISQNLI
jgi:hypothetical protein